MTAREWKPGDVVMVANHEGTPAVRAAKECRIAEHSHVTGEHWHYLTPVGGATWDSNPDRDARPLVVIDPEDREQVERLATALDDVELIADTKIDKYVVEHMQLALREFANPTPPRIDEPGVGGVVEASCVHSEVRLTWLRQADGNWHPLAPVSNPDDWDSLVEPVLIREGVTA